MIPSRIAAQDQRQQYAVIDLGTLGGTFSGTNGINNRGWVFGFANLSGDQEEHAFVWRNGVMTDLGTLGGPNSNVPFPVKNDRGLIAGGSQTSATDPLGENFFGPFTCTPSGALCQGGDLIGLGFLWQNGVLTALPTLGGNNGVATGVNNLGQVVGFAENNVQDPNCIPPQVLHWEAVIWGPKQGEIQELPPFPDDSVAAAAAINDSGQVVGGSGFCGPVSAAVSRHAVLWQNHSVIDLGSFGGAIGNVAFAINDRGQVVGLSDMPGDATAHAFQWENGVMADLGTLPGDFSSVAFGINDEGQVVGQSCDINFNCRAFLWQNGVMTDLNSLIPTALRSSLVLIDGSDINSGGEIAGTVTYPTGVVHGFLAIPTGDLTNPVESPRLNLPDNVRRFLRQRRGLGRL